MPRVEPRDPVADVARHLAAEEAGFLDIPFWSEIFQQKKEQLQKAMRFIWSGVQRIASKMVPDTTRQDRESGEAVARWMASGTYAHQAAEHYADKVLGEGSTPEFDRQVGATLLETRARYAKQAFLREAQKASADAAAARARHDPAAAKEAAQRATDMLRNAGKVVTLIGGDNSPFPTEDVFQAALANPKIQEAIERYRTEFVPLKEELFRKTQGLDPDEAIDSLTQLPGHPVRAFALRGDEADTGSYVAGAGRGNLRNLRLRRNPAAEPASLSADAYETDLRKIITQDLDRTAPLAAKAEAFRVLEANGVGRWGKPGDRQEGETEFPFANPPKGTQEAKPGETSWYVKGDAAGEWREALNIDPVKGYQKGLAALNYLPTVASVASTVEPTTHGVNLIGGLFAPRAIRGLFKSVYQRLFDKPAYRENLVELARIGAEKPPGLETGSLVGLLAPEHLQKPLSKYDPTYWTGRLLDGLSNLMRSSLGHAYDGLAADGHVPDTETGKRDFINGWVGQYEKKAQNGLIRWLRDTKIGPFATAASTMTARGVRMLAASPGTDATSWRSALIMRAEVFAKMAAVVGGTAAMNYALWGRADGDDKTPFLALKTGEKEGKTQYLDLSAITGLKRGMRAVPLLSYLVERERGVLPEAKTEEKVYDTVHSILHPALGPSVQLAHTAITGKDIMGHQIAVQTSKATTPRGIQKAVQMGKPLSGQPLENVKAALLNANPVLGSLLGAYTNRKTDLEDRFWHLFGSLAPKETTPPKIKK